jgi:hypothetical protein
MPLNRASEQPESNVEQDIQQVRQSVDANLNKLPVHVSYDELERAIPEVAAMKGLDQRSDFHSLTLDEHTKEFVRVLENNPFVSNHPKRDLILLIGKLHDLGKTSPEGVQVHPKDPNKRQYVGHEKASEQMVRALLPKYFSLSETDLELVSRLVGLHASALNLVGNFQTNDQPKGGDLKSYDQFIAQIEEIPGDLSLEDKMRILFAINRADKMAGTNPASDSSNPKVQDIRSKSEKQVSTLDKLEKALPALIAAVQGKRSGDQKAGVVLVGDTYMYNRLAPQPETKPVEIPEALKPLSDLLGDKLQAVAADYPKLQQKKGNPGALQGIVNGVLKKKLGLNETQVQKILETL